MDETYRMLGREHELDLEREAQKRHLAVEARAECGSAKGQVKPERPARGSFLPRQLVALLRLAASLR